jgi:hypothetical protein
MADLEETLVLLVTAQLLAKMAKLLQSSMTKSVLQQITLLNIKDLSLV